MARAIVLATPNCDHAQRHALYTRNGCPRLWRKQVDHPAGDPAELHRVYPAITTQPATQPAPPPDATGELVVLLRQQLDEMRNTLERERTAADIWRRAFEDERAQRSLPAPSHPAQPSSQPVEDATPWRRFLRWRRSAAG
jgi:hypothetical protein